MGWGSRVNLTKLHVFSGSFFSYLSINILNESPLNNIRSSKGDWVLRKILSDVNFWKSKLCSLFQKLCGKYSTQVGDWGRTVAAAALIGPKWLLLLHATLNGSLMQLSTRRKWRLIAGLSCGSIGESCFIRFEIWLWNRQTLSGWRGNYRGRLKSIQILLGRTQAGPGRKVKQEQEENSRNRVPSF